MRNRRGFTAAVATCAALGLAACSAASGSTVRSETAEEKPALVERVDGSQLSRVTLTEQAAKRLDIKTTPVREREVTPLRPVAGVDGSVVRKVIPYAAVLYDPKGGTWTYTSPKALTYLRHAITIEFIEGDIAVLADGPAVGTEVVRLGAIELFGAELGVGK